MNECTTTLAHVEEKHLLRCDITWPSPYSYARTYPAATQKGVADLCLCQLLLLLIIIIIIIIIITVQESKRL